MDRIHQQSRGESLLLGVMSSLILQMREFKDFKNKLKSRVFSTDGSSFKYENVTSLPSTKKGAIVAVVHCYLRLKRVLHTCAIILRMSRGARSNGNNKAFAREDTV
ncbi:hypothetical protein CDL15_Pgr004243 [Punica granatum]|uniref:Uncharacterized protein n=1 Tax=Punica granatum TaxID=22663 RepID=A0A218XHJ5_PUNGR|nr:hypothetical protein CDL15_Pgr004243 [Punica granatum]